MKKILGLDLGSASVGWAVIKEDENGTKIEALGSRIIPLSTDDANEFTQGKAISKNSSRTERRTQRKGYNRYQQRRAKLTLFLNQMGMLPDKTLIGLEKLTLWSLRAQAVNEQLTLPQIGRVLYHVNQKRGYRSSREDNNDKSQKDYVKQVNQRHQDITERGITIGQLFFEELSKDRTYRTKNQVFPRKAYQEEFDRIVACQREFYPEIFTDQNIDLLRNQIIFYQRSLKSCKHLVSLCEFELREYKKANGDVVFAGPKVAPRSSPLAQVCKIWENVNNITLTNRRGEKMDIAPSKRREMFEHLDNNEKLTLNDLYRILEIKKSDGWWAGKSIGKGGLQGNTTKSNILKALGDDHHELLRFKLSKTYTKMVDTETGELIPIISEDYQTEPLYRLWHPIYSIKDREELANALNKQFQITDQNIVDNLVAIDFVKYGYANKSAKSMRRILPFLELGLKYSEACRGACFRHSESLTTEEKSNRKLPSKIESIKKNELRQPVVEKILNQMINVVNSLMEKYGYFDEIRVELARELKQSKGERNKTSQAIYKSEQENKSIAERIALEYNLTPTRSRIQKYKMWQEADYGCVYCGKRVEVSDFLRGFEVEVEHIIPRKLFFDDSMSNKVCSCRNCNQTKGNLTAYDFMSSKSEGELNEYLERIERLFKDKKSTKYRRLLTKGSEIPTDFINRQLNESRYIARKAREILSAVCCDVTATSGSVTSFIRHIWGWDKVLHNLNFNRYHSVGLTHVVQREHKGSTWGEELITGWTKRLDHRHHAIDALVIACTKQGYIHRMNNMSELKDMNFSPDHMQGAAYQERLTKLEKYILSEPHFSTAEVERAVDSILISFKAGKRAASLGKRYVHRSGKRVLVQRDIIVPRGALHEESVTGSQLRYDKKGKLKETNVIKYKLGAGNGFLFSGKEDKAKCLKITSSIVDGKIKYLVEERLAQHNFNAKEAFTTTLYYDTIEKDNKKRQVITSIRCMTGFTAVVPVKHNNKGIPIGFSKTGNNHHVAIYTDNQGIQHEVCATLWHAVERKKRDIPVVITDPYEVWDKLTHDTPEQFLEQLPRPDWVFKVSLQLNEMFIMGMSSDAFEEALRDKDYALLSKYLYRVSALATKNYQLRHHIKTSTDDKYNGKKNEMLSKTMGALIIVQSQNAWINHNPIKVKISLLGEITKA